MSINYDYSLTIHGIDGGTYTPKYNKELKNVAHFNGKSGSGKSRG